MRYEVVRREVDKGEEVMPFVVTFPVVTTEGVVVEVVELLVMLYVRI